jgi:hypothetical protein
MSVARIRTMHERDTLSERTGSKLHSHLETAVRDGKQRHYILQTLMQRAHDSSLVASNPGMADVVYQSLLSKYLDELEEREDEAGRVSAHTALDVLTRLASTQVAHVAHGSLIASSSTHSDHAISGQAAHTARHGSVRSRSVTAQHFAGYDAPELPTAIREQHKAAAAMMRAGPQVRTPIVAAQFWSRHFKTPTHAAASQNITYLMEHTDAEQESAGLDANDSELRAQVHSRLSQMALQSPLLQHLHA